MALSRRAFVRGVGAGSAGLLASSVLGRGSEAWSGSAGQAQSPPAAGLVRLDSNENPEGPGPKTLDAVRGALGEACRYPHRAGTDLPDAIARFHKVPRANVLVACGSGEVLRIAVEAFVSPTRPLVTAVPTFETCTRTAQFLKYPLHEIPVDDRLALNLGAMEAKASESGLVFVCNPNNPTGSVHGGKTIADVIARIRKASPSTIVLVDEAYHEYVDDASYESALPLALEFPQVVVSRTFSKVYGMAGLRVGYAIGRPETLEKMSGWRLGNGLNMLGIRGAIAALDDRAWVERGRATNRAMRDRLRRAFEELGYKVSDSHGNFVFADIRRDAAAFAKKCREFNVAVGRPFPPLNTWTRVSVGTEDEVRQVIDVLRKVLAATTTVAVA
ncbi:MAG: pyridoxal phosphate-dependent aminotransferase [Bacteroidales bacterium]